MSRSYSHSLFVFCLFAVFLSPLTAQKTAPHDVPAPPELAKWREWILSQHGNLNCPAAGGQSAVCAWPGRLQLTLDDNGGRFEQTWTLYRDMMVPLPGNDHIWPQNVRNQGKPLIVTADPGRTLSAYTRSTPHVYLTAGEHRIQGEFSWQQSPTQFPIPPATALLDLTLNGKTVDQPRREQNGVLVLSGGPKTTTQVDQVDSLKVQIVRILREAVPFSVTTEVKLEASGRNREVTLHRPDLAGSRLHMVDSPLPIKRNEAGNLVVQVRSGKWTLSFESLLDAVPQELTVPEPQAEWGDFELWVYIADEKLRTVTPRQMTAVDPSQTHLDKSYHGYPCYAAEPGQTLRLEERQRGIGTIKANEVSLNRTIWLDENGKGATFRDKIEVRPHREWRLEMASPFLPGNAQINRVDQLLTVNPKTTAAGLTLREPTQELKVEGRIGQSPTNLPTTGWNTDLGNLEITLNLPPGWRVFSAFGPESVHGDWLRAWSLWQIFWVLIIAGAVTKLWDWRLGAVALVCMVLIYHELAAPRVVWLFLLLFIALHKYVTITWLNRLMQLAKFASWLAAIVLVTVFVFQQLLALFYPHLENVPLDRIWERRAPRSTPQQTLASPGTHEIMDMEEYNIEMPAEAQSILAQEASSAKRKVLRPDLTQNYITVVSKERKKDLPQGDIQTGPGVPNWSHNRLTMRWSNPVAADENLRIVLIAPWLNKLLILLRIGLVLFLLRALLQRDGLATKFSGKTAATVALVLLALPLSAQEKAMPSTELLTRYEQRLLTSAPCWPNCASIESADLRIDGNQVVTTLTVHAQNAFPLPLPGYPNRVSNAVGRNPALRRDEGGVIWAMVPTGISTLVVSQNLPKDGALIISWPIRPHRLTAATGTWQVIGIDENGRVANQIELRPQLVADPVEKEKAQERIQPAPFLHIERTLTFAMDWTVLTTVRLSNDQSVLVNVPLLPGERVLSQDRKTGPEGVAVALSPDRPIISWESRLEKVDALVLTAPANTASVETWRFFASPLWLIEWEGSPLIEYEASDRDPAMWSPYWRPRPGESLTVHARRPEPVSGQTLTIDNFSMRVEAGNRLQNTTIDFTLRASIGGEYQLTLPADVEVKEVAIGGRELPIIVEDGVLKIGYTPGKQEIKVAWRSQKSALLGVASPALNLGNPAVNVHHHLSVGRDRWVLFTYGPQMGPSVLFWPLFLGLVLVAIPLGRIRQIPLSTISWFLLGLGVLQLGIGSSTIAVLWFLAVGFYHRFQPKENAGLAFLARAAMVVFTLVFLGLLAGALSTGLLGQPNMYIYGPNRPVSALQWYNARSDGTIDPVGIWAVGIWVYRLLMLLWALWLANGLLRWLKWAWTEIFGTPLPKSKPQLKTPAATQAAAQPQAAPSDAPSEPQAAPPTEGEPPTKPDQPTD